MGVNVDDRNQPLLVGLLEHFGIGGAVEETLTISYVSAENRSLHPPKENGSARLHQHAHPLVIERTQLNLGELRLLVLKQLRKWCPAAAETKLGSVTDPEAKGIIPSEELLEDCLKLGVHLDLEGPPDRCSKDVAEGESTREDHAPEHVEVVESTQ